jgi:threonine synthase
VQCENGHLLDVKYKNKPNESLKEVFANRGRMDKDIIFNESGVWRFRELLNFCEIDTEDIEACSKYLVSLDGSEGRIIYGYNQKDTIPVDPSKIMEWQLQ